MKDILVIGYSTRSIVCSGRKAGYNVYSINVFCDIDLKGCACDIRQIAPEDAVDVKNMDPETLMGLIEDLNVDFDAIIFGSGFENMDLSNLPFKVLGNSPDVMRNVSDKDNFAKILASMGIPHPQTYPVDEPDTLQYPVMLKPKCGGGGIFNRVAESPDDLRSILKETSSWSPPVNSKDMMVQEFISGISASVSVISTGEKAISIAVNEQLIGVEWLSSLPFAYCGNITPFKTPYADEMCEIAEDLVLRLGLIGSNGVDFMVTKNGPVVIEVNPRFQGSLDSVEMATGVNIFDAHVKAFQSRLPAKRPSCKRFAGRAVLYSRSNSVVSEKLVGSLLEGSNADIPNVGCSLSIGDPVTSILAMGESSQDVLNDMENSSRIIHKLLEL